MNASNIQYTGEDASFFGDGIILIFLGIIVLITVVTIFSIIGIAISNYKSAKRYPENAKSNNKVYLKGLIIYLALVIGFLYVAQIVDCVTNKTNKDGWINPFSRTVRNGDIYVSQNIEFNLSENFTVTARYYDIKNLEITIHFFDRNDNEITSKTSLIGNVKAQSKENFSFSLSNFSATEILTIRKWSASVTGGTISTFSVISSFLN